MTELTTTPREYKSCTTILQYPLLSLLQSKTKRITSSTPLRWREDLEHIGIRYNPWRIGKLLEDATEMALQMLRLESKDTPEQLQKSQYYKNSCYKNNGLGADFILADALIECKFTTHHFTPEDFKKNTLPRFLDIFPNHEVKKILILWADDISSHTKHILKSFGIHPNKNLILIPFPKPVDFNLSHNRRRLIAAYIAARLEEILSRMPLFTLSNTNIEEYDALSKSNTGEDDVQSNSLEVESSYYDVCDGVSSNSDDFRIQSCHDYCALDVGGECPIYRNKGDDIDVEVKLKGEDDVEDDVEVVGVEDYFPWLTAINMEDYFSWLMADLEYRRWKNQREAYEELKRRELFGDE